MFANLNHLTELDLSDFDMENVTNLNSMFYGCSSLETLDLSSFDTRNVTNFNYMFNETTNLNSINFGPNFIHKNDATTTGMFRGCGAPERPTDDSWSDVSF